MQLLIDAENKVKADIIEFALCDICESLRSYIDRKVTDIHNNCNISVTYSDLYKLVLASISTIRSQIVKNDI